MKTREEYEQEFKSIFVTSGQEGWIKTQLEILLDIRELLLEAKQEREFEKIVEGRIRAEQERLSKVKLEIST